MEQKPGWISGLRFVRSTPSGCNRHHKDYSFFSSESPPKPSFSTVIPGVDPTSLGQRCGDVNLMTLISLHVTSCQLADIFGARQPSLPGFVIPINLAELNHMSTTWMATFGGGNFHLPSRSSTAHKQLPKRPNRKPDRLPFPPFSGGDVINGCFWFP